MPSEGSGIASGVAVMVLECRAGPTVLDALRHPERAEAVRLRPDRMLVVATEFDPSDIQASARQIREDNPSVFVVDTSAGWVARVLPKEGASALAALTSMWPDGPGTGVAKLHSAGLVAGVPAIVLGTTEGFLVLVGASHDHHLAGLLSAHVPAEPAEVSS